MRLGSVVSSFRPYSHGRTLGPIRPTSRASDAGPGPAIGAWLGVGRRLATDGIDSTRRQRTPASPTTHDWWERSRSRRRERAGAVRGRCHHRLASQSSSSSSDPDVVATGRTETVLEGRSLKSDGKADATPRLACWAAWPAVREPCRPGSAITSALGRRPSADAACGLKGVIRTCADCCPSRSVWLPSRPRCARGPHPPARRL